MKSYYDKVPFNIVIVILYSLIALLFYQIVVEPLQLNIRFGADSDVYVTYAESSMGDEHLVSVSSNYFGPVVLLRLLQQNLFFVAMINCLLFTGTFLLIQRYYSTEISGLKFTILLLINPMLFMSLATVNKEIFGLVSVAMLICFIKGRNFILLFLSLFFAVLTRWQQVLVNLLFLLVIGRFNPLKKRINVILAITVLISLIYPSQAALFSTAATDSETFDFQQDKLFGILPILNQLQDNYLFFIATIPKIMINLFGNIFRPFTILLNTITNNMGVDALDIYNSYIVTGHQLSMLFVATISIYKLLHSDLKESSQSKLKKRLRYPVSHKEWINNELFYCMIYCVLYSLGAFIQYRYFFPIYILFCLELSKRKSATTN